MSRKLQETSSKVAKYEPKRDKRGRFLKGYSGNPLGMPPGTKQKAHFAKTLNKMIGSEDFQEILATAVRLAKAGNAEMTKLLINKGIVDPKHPLECASIIKSMQKIDKDVEKIDHEIDVLKDGKKLLEEFKDE